MSRLSSSKGGNSEVEERTWTISFANSCSYFPSSFAKSLIPFLVSSNRSARSCSRARRILSREVLRAVDWALDVRERGRGESKRRGAEGLGGQRAVLIGLSHKKFK